MHQVVASAGVSTSTDNCEEQSAAFWTMPSRLSFEEANNTVPEKKGINDFTYSRN